MLPGRSAYTFDGNWKLQCENGLDGYHVSTVHFNYVVTVQQRHQVNAEKGGAVSNTLDYSKLGAGDATDDGWFSFKNGHSLLFSDMPNPSVRPGYATIMPRLVDDYGQGKARWMMHRLRNLNIYPSLFFMDQISSQLRVIRPLAWNKTEVISQCIGVKGESDKDRESRIRQFEISSTSRAWARRTTWWSSAKPSAASRPASSAGATFPAGTTSGSPAPPPTARRSASSRC